MNSKRISIKQIDWVHINCHIWPFPPLNYKILTATHFFSRKMMKTMPKSKIFINVSSFFNLSASHIICNILHTWVALLLFIYYFFPLLWNMIIELTRFRIVLWKIQHHKHMCVCFSILFFVFELCTVNFLWKMQ